jgi:hypothetical protein
MVELSYLYVKIISNEACFWKIANSNLVENNYMPRFDLELVKLCQKFNCYGVLFLHQGRYVLGLNLGSRFRCGGEIFTLLGCYAA